MVASDDHYLVNDFPILFCNGPHSQGVEYMPQHTNTYALARTNLRQYLRITKGPNQKWRKPKQRRTRNTTKTTQNTTYITTNMITSLPKETYIQKKIESEHQHEKKMTKRTQNPNKKKIRKTEIKKKS